MSEPTAQPPVDARKYTPCPTPNTRTGDRSKRNARYAMKHENTSQSASFPMLKNAMSKPKHVASIMAMPSTMSAEYTCRAPRTASPRFTSTAMSTAITPMQNTMTVPSRANSSVPANALVTPLPTPAVTATSADATTSLR